MGSTSKDDKRNADILAEDEEVDRKLNKKVKQGELKGLLGSIIADDLKVSSRPPSPASFSLDGRKHAEIFRTDLISAMKLPDQQNLSAENYMMITDPWRQEWERGVQVPVHPEGVFQASFRPVEPVYKRAGNFKLPSKLLTSASKARGRPTSKCPYNLGRIDVEWLTCLNKTRHNKGLMELEESMLEQAIAYIENKCYDNMGHAIATQEGLSIEYDEDVCCDVCQSPDSEELNEMVFCDSCDICVHQACYGIQNIPLGSWLCHPCRKGNKAPCCALCPHSGSAMKKAKNGKAWVHVSCALWIPEVGFGNVSKMEPVTRIENIPASRWNLVCSLCREKVGACIQCTIKSCVTAFHVTCGFKHGLEMRTVLDDSAADGVRHICYCARHSHKSKSPSKKSKEENKPASSEEAENLRQKRLKQMEEDFHKFVSVLEIAKDLNLPKELATRIHKYWTLKRKAQDDIPLLPPTLQQQEQLSGKQGSASSSNDLQAQLERVVKLRCNLEKLRNLCYMVTKREKMRRELYRAREEVFWKEHEVMTDESCDMDREEVRRVLTMCKDNFSGDGSAAAATTHDEGGKGGDSVLSYLSSRVSSTSNSPMSGLEDRSSTEQESGTESGTDDKRSSGGKTEECDEQDSKMAPSPTPSSEEDLPPRRTRRNSHLLGQPSSSVVQSSSFVGQSSSSVGQSSSSVGQSSSSVGQSSSSVEPAEPARECPKRVENTDKSEQRPRTKSLSFSEGDVVRPQRMRRSAAARDVKVHTAEKTRTRRTRHHSLPDLEEDEKEEPLPPSDEDVRMSDAMPREARTRTLRAGKVAKRPEKSESGSQQETSQKPEVDEKESLKENDPLRPEFSLVRRRSTSSSNNRNKTKATKRRRSKSSDTSTDGSTRSKQARITEFLRRKSPKSPKSGRRRGHGKSSAEESECEQVRTEIHVDHSTKGVPSPKTFSNGREVPPASSACPTCKVQHDKHSKTCLCGKESSRAAEGCEESWSRRELRLRSFQSPKSRARCSQAVSPKPHCCSSLMVKFCHATVT